MPLKVHPSLLAFRRDGYTSLGDSFVEEAVLGVERILPSARLSVEAETGAGLPQANVRCAVRGICRASNHAEETEPLSRVPLDRHPWKKVTGSPIRR